jgi:hypothetical protein
MATPTKKNISATTKMSKDTNIVLAIKEPVASATNAIASTIAEECTICCETYNKSSRACIECEYTSCNYKTCLACVRAYLLTSTNEPHCMECKQPWTPKFMLSMTKKWLAETYKPHREKFLCDVELSKLAETMEAAERYKAASREEHIRHELRLKERALRQQLYEISSEIGASINREHRLKRGLLTANGSAIEAAAERKVFFMSCPVADCNGMLSTQYKCGICEQFTCQDCHEVIGLNRTATEHTCDPNNIASAEAIRKETKQCPGCHNRIYRTEGCSQMWCTGCHTAFDWNTGRKVVHEQLHNPHWLEYQRSQNNGQAPRAPGDVPCGGLIGRHELQTRILSKLLTGTANNLVEQIRHIYRFVLEASANQVRELREQCQQLRDFQHQRIKYIVGEMTKEQLAAHIFKSDRSRQKNTELLHIYELLSAVGIDLFNRLLTSELYRDEFNLLVIAQIAEYNQLRQHCNGLFATISNTYNQMVPQVCEYWLIQTEKFNSKTMKMFTVEPAPAPAKELLALDSAAAIKL